MVGSVDLAVTWRRTLGAGSSRASLVRKDTLGGQVRLDGAYMPAMSEARMVMLQ